MIGILAENYDFNLVERTGVEGREDSRSGGIDRSGGILTPDEFRSAAELFAVEDVLKLGLRSWRITWKMKRWLEIMGCWKKKQVRPRWADGPVVISYDSSVGFNPGRIIFP